MYICVVILHSVKSLGFRGASPRFRGRVGYPPRKRLNSLCIHDAISEGAGTLSKRFVAVAPVLLSIPLTVCAHRKRERFRPMRGPIRDMRGTDGAKH